MQDLIILTDEPITLETCEKVLKEKMSDFKTLNSNSECLYMKNNDKGFELWFTPNDSIDDPEFEMGETLEKCPNKKAFLTNLSYSSRAIGKRVITLIQNLYGNMWIQSDEEDNWFGSANDFINIYCSNKNN